MNLPSTCGLRLSASYFWAGASLLPVSWSKVMGIRNPIFDIIGVFRKVVRIPIVLARNGFLHSFHLIHVCFVCPIVIKVLPIYVKCYVEVKRITDKYYSAEKEIRYWQQNKEELLRLGKRGYRIKIEDLGLNQEKLELLKKVQQQSHEVVIAEIDEDGFLLSHFGVIRNAPTVSQNQFLVRKHFNLKLTVIDGYVGVKKDYKGDKVSFVNEIKVLHCLGLTGCNVPAIMDVDFDNLTLTFSYILGRVLREELARSGAVLRDRDVDNNSDFLGLDPTEKRLKRIQEGKRVLHNVIDSQFVESLFTELNKIHASGFILRDIKYGNMVIEKKSGKPYLIDFEGARHYPNLGKHSFKILRDRDIEKFNLLFDTEKLTYKRTKGSVKIMCRKE